MNNNQGFLHSHEHLIPHRNEEHVLVDKKDWLIAREHFAALQSAQQPQTEICSKDICEYCVGCGEMSSCVDHSKFNGRKLSPHAADVGMQVFEQTKGGRDG